MKEVNNMEMLVYFTHAVHDEKRKISYDDDVL